MRKLILLLVIFMFAVGLSSCNGSDEPIDLTIQIAEETVVETDIEVHIIIPIKIKSMSELNEIAMNVASQTYEEYFETIGTQSYTLTIYVYASNAEYTANDATLGSLSFDINKDVTSPGLSIDEDLLIYE